MRIFFCKMGVIGSFFGLYACGHDARNEGNNSAQLKSFAHIYHDGYKVEHSVLMLPPGKTVSICDTLNFKDAGRHFRLAVETWLSAAGRARSIYVKIGCSGDRVFKIVKNTQETRRKINQDFTAYTHALSGNVHTIEINEEFFQPEVTPMHEVGHAFGFGHVFNNNVSVMNVDDFSDKPEYMNQGRISEFDKQEIANLLSLPEFREVNKLWRH